MRAVPSERIDLYLALEEAQAVRSRRFHVTALLSFPLPLVALWPELLSELGRRAVLTCWALSAAGALWAFFAECRLRARALDSTR